MAHNISPGLVIGILRYPSISRGLDGLLERTLSVLSAGVHRSYPSERQRLSDLDVLLRLITQQRQYCETLSFLAFYEEDSIGTIANDYADILCYVQTPYGKKNGSYHDFVNSKSAHSRPPPPPVLFSVSRSK